MRILAGDIGGTNARLALVEHLGGDELHLRAVRVYPSGAYRGLGEIVGEFRAELDVPVVAAAFGVAGPVIDGEYTASNLPWRIRQSDLAAQIGIPVTLLVNDFEAVGHGVPWLRASDLFTLQPGERVERGTLALIGAGTGLGEGFLAWSGGGYTVHPSEGGHADFAARDELQWELARFLRAEYGNASCERVLSGPGLGDLYRFLRARGRTAPDPAVEEELERADPAAVVTRYGLARSDRLCSAALDLFVAVYGAQAGNLALTVMATGGVYLAGGIAPRIREALAERGFRESFVRKGRLTPVLEMIPVHVIMNPEVGLIGAAAVALAAARAAALGA